MDKKKKDNKTAKSHKAPSTSTKSQSTSTDTATMAHYVNHTQSVYSMPSSAPQMMSAMGTHSRLPADEITDEEIYAMNQMNNSSLAFAESFPSPYNTGPQLNIESGYSPLSPGDYLVPGNRYTNVQPNAYGRTNQNAQLMGHPNAFPSWSQSLETSHVPHLLSGAASGTPSTVWAGNHMSMSTSASNTLEQSLYGISPGYDQNAPETSMAHQEGSFKCDIEGCGKLFTRSYNYKAHLETHDERREYPFHCHVDGCDKKFARKTDLQRHHQSVHMKERNHGCAFCGRFFARKDTLRRHMEDGCSKRFDIETIDLANTMG